MRTLTSADAERFAALALDCVGREYPNKISHLLNSDADVGPPRRLTPAFYGCYDWHSAVHNHWLLIRLCRLFPQGQFANDAWKALQANLTPANIRQEAAYMSAIGRASFERPYGLAWLLQLCQEFYEWQTPPARELLEYLHPLEQAAKQRLGDWLPKLPYPVRSGEHSQTAFALGLMLDYSQHCGDPEFLGLLTNCARRFYLQDRDCPLAYEPSGEDFLSPALAEADVMRRVLPSQEFAGWLKNFLPQLSAGGGGPWLTPVTSPDPGDPKFSHLDGLNLSRAWMLERIASALPAGDRRRFALTACAGIHAQAGLRAVNGEHYVGSHWLGTFAVYLMTARMPL